MPFEHDDLSAGRGVPHARGVVIGRRHHPCPVGREGCGNDLALMPFEPQSLAKLREGSSQTLQRQPKFRSVAIPRSWPRGERQLNGIYRAPLT